MKINFYITLILLFSLSILKAQNEVKPNKTKVTISCEETRGPLVDKAKVEEVIVKSTSDIRSFLNLERKVENIKIVFPKIVTRRLS